MRKKILLVLVGVLVVGGVALSTVAYNRYKQQRLAEQFPTKPPLDTVEPPTSLSELRSLLAGREWSELYVASSANGTFALGVLGDIRRRENIVVREESHRMYINGELKASDESNPGIVLANCAQVLEKPFVSDNEYNPGNTTLTLYATDTDLNKANQIYISPGKHESELGTTWPILYGPYTISVAEAKSSFASLACFEF